MASLNKVMLIGNLTRDAELRYLPSGQAVLEFRLAVSRKFRRQDGTDGEETCFVDINFWGKRAEAVAQYLTKGKPLFVEGRLQLDEWEDKESGQKRSRMKVVAENIEFLGGGRSDSGPRPAAQENGASSAQGGQATGAQRPSSYQRPPAVNGSGAPGRSDPYGHTPSAPPTTASAMQLADEDIPF